MGKQKSREQLRRKAHNEDNFWALKALKKYLKGQLQVTPRNLQELLTKAPRVANTEICRKAMRKAINEGQEDIVHILNETGVLYVMKPVGMQRSEHFSAAERSQFELATNASSFLTTAANMHLNKLNEELRLTGTTEAVNFLVESGAQPNYFGAYGCTAVHEAAYCGRLNCLLALLQQGGDFSARTAEGRTVLHAAAIGGDESCVAVLIKAGVDVQAVDYFSMSALHFAAGSARSAGCVLPLLAAGADVNGKDNFEMSPLHYAAAYGTEEVVMILLNASADRSALDYKKRIPGELVYSECESVQRRRSRCAVYRLLHPADGVHDDDMEGINEDFIWDEEPDITEKSRTMHVLRTVAWDSEQIDRNELNAALFEKPSFVRSYSACKALQACAEEDNFLMLKDLLKLSANPNARESNWWTDEEFHTEFGTRWLTCDRDDWPLIHLAAGAGNMETVEALEHAGASLERVWVFDYADPFGPLEAAAANGHIAVVKMLLYAGCVSDREQLSGALRLAVTPEGWRDDKENWDEMLQMKVARMLLDAGADPNAQDVFGHTALLGAANCGWCKCLGLLVRRGANILTESYSGRTALHAAARGGKVECVDFLIKEGANVNSKDSAGRTALHYVAEGRMNSKPVYTPCLTSGAKETVEALLKAGAKIDAVDNAGATALHLAAASPGGCDIVEALLKGGACVNAKDRDGRTPLHYAADAGFDTVIELNLLKAGADPEAKDSNGVSPLDLKQMRLNVEGDDESRGSWAGDSSKDESEEDPGSEEESSEYCSERTSEDDATSNEGSECDSNDEFPPCNVLDEEDENIEWKSNESECEDESQDEESSCRYWLRSQSTKQAQNIRIESGDEAEGSTQGWHHNRANDQEQNIDIEPDTESLEGKYALRHNEECHIEPDVENRNQQLGQNDKVKIGKLEVDCDSQHYRDDSTNYTWEKGIKKEVAGGKFGERTDFVQEQQMTLEKHYRSSEWDQQTCGEDERISWEMRNAEQEHVIREEEELGNWSSSNKYGAMDRPLRVEGDGCEENNVWNRVGEQDRGFDEESPVDDERHVRGKLDYRTNWESRNQREQGGEDDIASQGETNSRSVWSRLERRSQRNNADGRDAREDEQHNSLIVTRILDGDQRQARRYIQQSCPSRGDRESDRDKMSVQDEEDEWQSCYNRRTLGEEDERGRPNRGERDGYSQGEDNGRWSEQRSAVVEDDDRFRERENWNREDLREPSGESERVVYVEDTSQEGMQRRNEQYVRHRREDQSWNRQERNPDIHNEWREQQVACDNERFEAQGRSDEREDEWNRLSEEGRQNEPHRLEEERDRYEKKNDLRSVSDTGERWQRHDNDNRHKRSDDWEGRSDTFNFHPQDEAEDKYREWERADNRSAHREFSGQDSSWDRHERLDRQSREQRHETRDRDSNSGRSELSGRGNSWDQEQYAQGRERRKIDEREVKEFSREDSDCGRHRRVDKLSEKREYESYEHRVYENRDTGSDYHKKFDEQGNDRPYSPHKLYERERHRSRSRYSRPDERETSPRRDRSREREHGRPHRRYSRSREYEHGHVREHEHARPHSPQVWPDREDRHSERHRDRRRESEERRREPESRRYSSRNRSSERESSGYHKRDYHHSGYHKRDSASRDWFPPSNKRFRR